MLQVEIKHSFVVDIKIFFQTLKYKRWLDKTGYFYYLFDKEILKNIDYRKISQEVGNELSLYDNKLEDVINTRKEYKIFLTKLGTFGSYELPNTVFVNAHRSPAQIVETIIHELVHLEVEAEVERRKLSHEQKEKMVDGMVEKILKK